MTPEEKRQARAIAKAAVDGRKDMKREVLTLLKSVRDQVNRGDIITISTIIEVIEQMEVKR